MIEENESLIGDEIRGPEGADGPPRKGRLGGIVLIVIGLLIIGYFGFDWVALAGGADTTDLPVSAQVGARAPDFSLRDLNGNTIALSDLRGKPVLVNFWATWCAPCRLEMPYIQARYEQYGGDLIVLAVDFDEPQETVQAFVDELGLTFDVVLDPGAQVQEQYEIRAYPTSYFVDGQGVIRVVHIGIMSEDQLDGYLREVGLQ